MIRLPRQVCWNVVIGLFRLERRIAEITPQHGVHSQRVGLMEHRGDFLDLALRFLRTEIDCGANSGAAHVERLFYIREKNLVETVRIRQKLVVIELKKKGNLVRVLTRD